MNEFYLFLIFACSALDAMRDGFRSTEMNGISQKGWHAIKRIGWYPPMIFMWWQISGFWELVFGAALGLIGWRIGLLFTPVRWKSVWFKYSIIIFNKIKSLFQKTI